MNIKISELKPSQRIRQVKADLLALQNDPEITFDMSEWAFYDEQDDICSVCVAGAHIYNHHIDTCDLNEVGRGYSFHLENEDENIAQSFDGFRCADFVEWVHVNLDGYSYTLTNDQTLELVDVMSEIYNKFEEKASKNGFGPIRDYSNKKVRPYFHGMMDAQADHLESIGL